MQFTRIRKTATLFEIYFCREALGKIFSFAMWFLGGPAGAARRNWDTPVRDSVGGWVGKVEGLTDSRFVAVDGWGSTGARPATGGQRAPPRNALVRLWSGLGGGAVGAGRLGRPCGTAMVHWTRPIALEEGCSGVAHGRTRRAAACASRPSCGL
jgi:hypothetical protein